LYCIGYFWDRVSWTICPGWLRTPILLISASWVAKITGRSHRLTGFPFFKIHSLVDRPLYCFQALTIKDKAGVNILVQLYAHTYFCFPWVNTSEWNC
jgi:hypothetical protein